jgi:hypothetical protein
MSKEELEINSNKTENNFDETENTKKLCVHELTRKLKNKQRKESISKAIILLITIFFIIFLSIIFY